MTDHERKIAYLGSQQGKAGRHGCFEYTQEDTNSDSSLVALDTGEAAQDETPH